MLRLARSEGPLHVPRALSRKSEGQQVAFGNEDGLQNSHLVVKCCPACAHVSPLASRRLLLSPSWGVSFGPVEEGEKSEGRGGSCPKRREM
jgi:hypothetical protein